MATVTDLATKRVYEGDAAHAMLERIGIYHERIDVGGIAPAYPLEKSGQETVLDRFRSELTRLGENRGYRRHDLIQLHPGTPGLEELLAGFERLHHHTEDEVRFIVHGEGVFTVERDGGRYAVLVRAGDVMAVPAGTRHFFTLTDRRTVTAVRLFADPAGWVPIYEPDLPAADGASV